MNSASSSASPERSIVVPCYNERRRLPKTLESILHYVDARSVPTEVVIVDDGSKDDTADWVNGVARTEPRVHLVGYGGNRGKGFAVKTGLLDARGRAVLFMDADGATPIEESDKFWPILAGGQADIVIGSRRAAGSEIAAAQSALRSLGSEVFAWLSRILLVYGVMDTQCGFKAFSREAIGAVCPRLTSPTAIFDVELLALAARARLRIAEVPVRWTHDSDSRITYDMRKSARIILELLRLKAAHRVVWPAHVRPVSPA